MYKHETSLGLLPPGEGGGETPCPICEGPTLGSERCDASWMAGSMFDLYIRAKAEPDMFTQELNVHSKGSPLPAAISRSVSCRSARPLVSPSSRGSVWV